MTNKTITLSLELAEEMAAYGENMKFLEPRMVEQLRAALADPVPPAGGDKPALYLDARGFEIVTRCLTVSVCIDVRAHQAGELFDHYRPDGLVPVYSEETVTRLQAEVAKQRKLVREECGLKLKAQSELTKARELLADMRCNPKKRCAAFIADIIDVLDNQSAPADKDEECVHDFRMFSGECHKCGADWIPGKEYAPVDKAPPLIQALHANGDRIAMEATIAQQAQRIADLEAGEPVAPDFKMIGTEPIPPMEYDEP